MEQTKTTREIIESQMEKDPTPARILAVISANEGKSITKRLIPKLKDAGVEQPRINKIGEGIFGRTTVEWGPYNGNTYNSIDLAKGTKNVFCDSEYVVKANPRWYDARDMRNKKREDMLATDMPEKIDQKLNKYVEAKRVLEKMREELTNDLTGMPDHYQILSQRVGE